MKKRADQAIKDSDLGPEGWAQMVSRATKGFPEKVKHFLREQFLNGEESASAKVSCVITVHRILLCSFNKSM